MFNNKRKSPLILAFMFVLSVMSSMVAFSNASDSSAYSEPELVAVVTSLDVCLDLVVNSDDWSICGVKYFPIEYVVKKGEMYLQADGGYSLTSNSFALVSEIRVIDSVLEDDFDGSVYEITWKWSENVTEEFYILGEDIPHSKFYKNGSIITAETLKIYEYSFGREMVATPATALDIRSHYEARGLTPTFTYTITSTEHIEKNS